MYEGCKGCVGRSNTDDPGLLRSVSGAVRCSAAMVVVSELELSGHVCRHYSAGQAKSASLLTPQADFIGTN